MSKEPGCTKVTMIYPDFGPQVEILPGVPSKGDIINMHPRYFTVNYVMWNPKAQCVYIYLEVTNDPR